MRIASERLHIAATVTLGVGLLVVASALIVTTAGAQSVDTAAVPAGGSAALTYDLAGLPADAVLVVEHRNGAKGAFVEVARSNAGSGVLTVGTPATPKSLVRMTVVNGDGDVLIRVERMP